jgi:hypothetical protein
MGVLTKLVIADVADAGRVQENDDLSTDFRSIDVRGIDPVKLYRLRSVLLATPYDNSWIKGFAALAGTPDDGHWTCSVPADLIEALTEVAPDQLGDIAQKWHDTEEFRLDRWSLADVKSTLQEIHTLCSESQSEGKSVLMWMSL